MTRDVDAWKLKAIRPFDEFMYTLLSSTWAGDAVERA